MNDTSDTIDATSKDNGEDPTSDLSGGSSPTNMRSSPPVPEDDETVIEDPPKMNKKRSHEEMNAMTDEMFPSSATMIGDVASSAVPPKESDQPDSIKHSQVTHTMGPPALPSSSMPPPSQKTPPSGQGSQKPKANEIKPAGPNPEDREKGPSPEPEHNPEPDDALDAATGEPQEQIDDFDWKDLHSRYHQKMTALDEQENEVMDNFHQLCQVRHAPSVIADILILL